MFQKERVYYVLYKCDIHVPKSLLNFGRWSKDFSYLTKTSNMWYIHSI
nr:MAG TPA: hypothetical protein [Bacteriophage sp.]